MGHMKKTLRDKGNLIRTSSIHLIGVPQRRKRKMGERQYFKEIIAEKFPEFNKMWIITFQDHKQVPKDKKDRTCYKKGISESPAITKM